MQDQTPVNDLEMMPGAPIESRPLQLIVLADCSGSMAGAKIASLNSAMVEALDALRDISRDNPTARIEVRAIAFESSSRWHIATPTSAATATWPALQCGGTTDMAGAVTMLSDALDVARMPPRGLPPVLVLVSDGAPDDQRSYEKVVDGLLAKPWGKKAVRLGIAIGEDAFRPTLERFIANPEIPVLVAKNSADLVRYIRWATVTVTQAASRPVTQTGTATSNVMVQPPAPVTSLASPMDVW